MALPENPPSTPAQEDIQLPENPPSSTTAQQEIQPLDVQSSGSSDLPEPLDPSLSGNGESVTNLKRKEPSEDEPKPSSNPMWKTSLCSFYRRHNGNCSHGDACRYAHGEEELRPKPDQSWDPTSLQGKKLLKSEAGERCEAPEDAREDLIPSLSGEEDSVDPALDRCLVHLPQKWTSENLKSFLETQGVSYKTAKKKKGMTVGFVSFETLEHVKNAIEELNGKSMGSKQIKVANVLPRSFENKETIEKDNWTVDGSGVKTRSVRDVVTPLAHMPYNDQLEHKKSSLSQILKRLTRNVRKACSDGVPLPEWILKSREIGSLPCKLEGILESPVVNGYRNKCEFSVGYSLQGQRTIGFMLGNFREGMTAVEEPVDCPNVSSIACKYASFFQEFIRSSGLPVWNRTDNTGFWRQFTVREGRSGGQSTEGENVETNIGEVMLIVQVCSTGSDEQVIKDEFERMAQALVQGAYACSPPLPLTALVVQDHKGISNAAPDDCPLLSIPIPKAEGVPTCNAPGTLTEATIHDYLSNLRFRISPTAFFQVNTLAAEKLYSLAGDWADLGPDTLLFDICCGTGTIGLTLAHRVGMVVGIEMNASAVSDAHRNAEINGIKNCRFVCSKAEHVMAALLKEYLDVMPHKENMNDEEDGSHDQKSFDGSSECLHDTNNCNLELATVAAKEEVEAVDPNNDNAVNACKLNGALDHEMSGAKSTSSCQNNGHGNVKESNEKKCLSEDNGTSSIPMKQFKNVVAIVDPPRVGLHPTVIKALRTHPHLRRLVYISCNPESLVANAIELCTPAPEKFDKGKNNRGWRNMSMAGLARHRAKSMPNSEPFRPVRAVAVDMFPHTPHCETVMLLER